MMVDHTYRNGESIVGSRDSGKDFKSCGEYQHNISSSGAAGMPTGAKTRECCRNPKRLKIFTLYLSFRKICTAITA